MVEFALVLLPLTLIVLGIVQLGFVVHAKIDETHLAASAARFAAVNQNPGGDAGARRLHHGQSRPAGPPRQRRRLRRVSRERRHGHLRRARRPGDASRSSYDFDLVPGVGGLMDPGLATINIGGSATMRLETFPTNIPEGCSA